MCGGAADSVRIAFAGAMREPLPPAEEAHRLCLGRPMADWVGGGASRASWQPRRKSEIRQLTQRMLRKKLYVVFSKGNATPEQIGALLPQHLEFMIGLEKKGMLFASGPVSLLPNDRAMGRRNRNCDTAAQPR
jgi:hypothetical protein